MPIAMSSTGVLDLRADLRKLLKGKLSTLNLDSEPYFSVARLLG
jgi:hypothetical protein